MMTSFKYSFLWISLMLLLVGMQLCCDVVAFVPPSTSSSRRLRRHQQDRPIVSMRESLPFDLLPNGDNKNNNNNNNNGEDMDVLPTPSTLQNTLILMAPAIMAYLAFATYKETSKIFHEFVDVASGHTWSPVDGGTYLTDLISPALTGPVASFISLLFGTLASMTVSNLYERQGTLAKATTDLLEDIRLMEIHVTYFPADYRKQAERLLNQYMAVFWKSVQEGLLVDRRTAANGDDGFRKESARASSRRLLEDFMVLQHEMTSDPTVNDSLNERVLDQSYDTLNRIFRSRSQLISTYETSFPIWHYGNLTILALAICFIFLVLTDKTALMFLGGFQLRLCWGMMIGTFTMLAIVIYDLQDPLSGAFQIIDPMRAGGFHFEEYAKRAKDENLDEIIKKVERKD